MPFRFVCVFRNSVALADNRVADFVTFSSFENFSDLCLSHANFVSNAIHPARTRQAPMTAITLFNNDDFHNFTIHLRDLPLKVLSEPGNKDKDATNNTKRSGVK